MDTVIHPYDVLMLAVLLGATIFGALRGMAWQLASLSSVLLSAAAAIRFSPALAPYLSKEEPWNRFLAMLLIYLACSLAIWLVFHLVAEVIERVRLKDFDRQTGALFGAVKGVLLCLVITFFAVTLSQPARQAVLRSRTGYYTTVLIQRGVPFLPQEIRNVLGKYIEELKQKLEPDRPEQPPSGKPRA